MLLSPYSYRHSCQNTHIHTYICIHAHTYTHTAGMYTYAAPLLLPLPTQLSKYAYPYIHTYIHTYVKYIKYIHTYMHIHTHTHIHTNTAGTYTYAAPMLLPLPVGLCFAVWCPKEHNRLSIVTATAQQGTTRVAHVCGTLEDIPAQCGVGDKKAAAKFKLYGLRCVCMCVCVCVHVAA